MAAFAGIYAMIDQEHVLCSQYAKDKENIEQLNLEVFSISKGQTVNTLRLTKKHNIARNDPFFGVEVFENLVEFRSLALPKTAYAYEMPLREKLITFADACDEKDIEDTRAFYLVVEICEMCWLRKVVVTHDKLSLKLEPINGKLELKLKKGLYWWKSGWRCRTCSASTGQRRR